ncbi:MAG: metallophosphoesterase [Lachnospiraceae bacterium]|nr:metallophosphoesterase [Lachnospiraceae bacterium]
MKKIVVRIFIITAFVLSVVLAGCAKTEETAGSAKMVPVSEESVNREALTDESAPQEEDTGDKDADDADAGEAETDTEYLTDLVPAEKAPERKNLTREERARIQEEKGLNIFEKTLEVEGLDRDLDILFIADSHLSLCDDRDMEVYDKAVFRYGNMLDANGRPAYQTFHEFVDYANAEKPDLLILGGDIVDSAMMASINFLQGELKNLSVPYLYVLGNHDFEYGNEYYSKRAYEEFLPRLLEVSHSDKGSHLYSLGGMYVFAADDSNSQYTEDELAKFKEICDDGRPVLFVTHVPIEPGMGNTELYDKSIELFGTDSKGNSRALIGEHSVIPNVTTQEMLDLVLADDSNVFCVLAGHVHYPHEDLLNENVTQIVTGAAFRSRGVLLHLKAK